MESVAGTVSWAVEAQGQSLGCNWPHYQYLAQYVAFHTARTCPEEGGCGMYILSTSNWDHLKLFQPPG